MDLGAAFYRWNFYYHYMYKSIVKNLFSLQWVETNPSNIFFPLWMSVFTSPHGTMLIAYRCQYMDVHGCQMGWFPPTLQLIFRYFTSALCYLKQFSAPFKAGNSRQAQTCNNPQTATQRKCNIKTGFYQFRRNESSHGLDS